MDMTTQNSDISLKYRDKNTEEELSLDQKQDFIENYHKIQISEILKISGNEGKYQYFIFSLFSFVYLALGITSNIIPYSYYTPKFFCKDEHNNEFECSHKMACDLNNFRIEKKRESLITQFNLYCGNDFNYVNTSQLYIFIGSAVISLFVALISDRIGRKKSFFIILFLFIGGFLSSILFDRFFFIVLGIVVVKSGILAFHTIANLYINEICSNFLRSKFLFFDLISSLGSICVNFLLVFIEGYKNFFLLCFLIMIFFTAFFYRIIESPYFIFFTKDVKNFYLNLNRISYFNEKCPTSTTIQLNKELSLNKILSQKMETVEYIKITNPKKKNLKKITQNFFLIFQKEHLKNLFFSFFFIINLYINNCVSITMPQKLGYHNIYLMNTLFSICDLIGFIIILPISHVIKRRKLNIYSTLSVIIFIFLLLLNEYFNKNNSYYVFFATLISCFLKIVNRFGFSLAFNYIGELFPTKIRGLAMGLIITLGRCSESFGGYFYQLSVFYDIHPLILTGLPAFLALPASYYLPETVDKNLIN